MKSLFISLALVLVISCNNKKQSGTENQTTSTTTITPEKETSQSSAEVDESLVGKWTPTEIDIPNMREEQKEKILNKATIEFTEDGNYISISENDNETGTYDYNTDARSLRTFTPQGDTEILSVKWEKDFIKMTSKEGIITFKRVNQ